MTDPVKFLDLRHQYHLIKDEIDSAIAAVLDTSAFVGGPFVAEFEQAFAGFQGAEHCVGVGNGTDAIEIALEALALPSASEVIVPANSFIASSEAVTRAGHRPVFADVDPHSYLLDLADVEQKITDRTGAILCVHLFGNPSDMDALGDLAKRYGLRMIEDAAQAHGAEWRGRRIGALGDVGTFSFYPGKNLGAYGDGGAIVTNDADLARRCRMIANHGRTTKYEHEFEGRNSRLDALQAAVLTVKLRHLDIWIDRRGDIARQYIQGLTDVDSLVLPTWDEASRHAFHLFVILTPQRDELAAHLRDDDIQTGVHYPVALPKLAAYRHHGLAEASMTANVIDSQLLSLPIGEHLSDDEVDRVVHSVRKWVSQSREAAPA